MWSPNHLKRNQIDSDDEKKQIFMEKRQRVFRKKRRKTAPLPMPSDQLGVIGSTATTRLISLPGISSSRLTMKLGNLTNGIQGTAPAIRKIQQKIDLELAQHNIDLNSIKGPPTYRNLPKPAFSEAIPEVSSTAKCVRPNQLQSKEKTSIEASYQQYNRMLGMKICEAWPNLMYETELQMTLNKHMERFKTKARSTPQPSETKVKHGSGHSATSLSKPFSTWSINEGEDSGSSAFNQSFCRTIKRTFYRECKEGSITDRNHVVDEGVADEENTGLGLSDPELDVSASALSLFGTKYDTEDSGRGSTDFLDTITDSYHDIASSHSNHSNPSSTHSNRHMRVSNGYHSNNSTSSNNFQSYDPYLDISKGDNNGALFVRGVKKDFVDIVDSMYPSDIDQPTYSHVTARHPMGQLHSNHVTERQPMAEVHSKSRGLIDNYKLRQSKKSASEPYYFPIKENRDPNGVNKVTDKREPKSLSGKSKKVRNKKFYVNKEWLR